MSGTGTVVVQTSSTGPANAPTGGAFGTGTLALGATKMRGLPTADITIGNAITFSDNPTFGISKGGAGTLLLSGTSTYNGATSVSAGTLYVTGSLANSAVTIEDNAALGGAGVVASVTFEGGSRFDIFEAIANTAALTSNAISFSTTGFGIDNLVFNGSAVDWSTITNGTYTHPPPQDRPGGGSLNPAPRPSHPNHPARP